MFLVLVVFYVYLWFEKDYHKSSVQKRACSLNMPKSSFIIFFLSYERETLWTPIIPYSNISFVMLSAPSIFHDNSNAYNNEALMQLLMKIKCNY